MALTTFADLTAGSPVPASLFCFQIPAGDNRKVDLAAVLTALGIQSAAVAGLGTAATANRYKYATNGRKIGETAGNGTGVMVRTDGTNWRTVDAATVVSA